MFIISMKGWEFLTLPEIQGYIPTKSAEKIPREVGAAELR